MDNINRDYIQTYIQGLIKNESDKLEKFRNECIERHLPIIQRETAQLIKVLLLMHNPKSILEVGTNVGFSSIYMCTALDRKVKVLSIEKSEEYYQEALSNIRTFECEDNISVINSDASEALDMIINTNEKFDIAFIDAAKSHYTEFLNKIIAMMNPGGLIISDNVLYKGLIANDELVTKRKRTIVRNMREYLEYISTDDKFETSIIPIGDGLALTKLK